MAEEFQAAVCGGSSWWSSPTATFNGPSFNSSCWQNGLINFKTISTDNKSSGCYTTAISPDSAFTTMDSSPSTTTNWYEALLVNEGVDEISYNQSLPEILNNLPGRGQNSSKFSMGDEQTSNFTTTSAGDHCTGNSSVATSYGYPSSLLQTLLGGASSDAHAAPPPAASQLQQPLYDFQGNLNDFGTWNIKSGYEDHVRDMGSLKKKTSCSTESTFKRPRLETPSPLPTFKVRKEKLGDRVTALQQLVSPFGKTDTASVLQEAIEYIKLLHDQVNVLSSPYMKNGATTRAEQINGKVEDNKEGAKQQELRSRGLCLVPVSSTFPVATETAPDYWTSSFRNTF